MKIFNKRFLWDRNGRYRKLSFKVFMRILLEIPTVSVDYVAGVVISFVVKIWQNFKTLRNSIFYVFKAIGYASNYESTYLIFVFSNYLQVYNYA